MPEFESCCRIDYVQLDFDPMFALWVCAQNIVKQTDYPLTLFCMGWEL